MTEKEKIEYIQVMLRKKGCCVTTRAIELILGYEQKFEEIIGRCQVWN